MTTSIISRDTIRARARRAFAAGKGRHDHEMNPGSAAIVDWQAEWDLCARQSRRLFASTQRRMRSPIVDSAAPGRADVAPAGAAGLMQVGSAA